MVVEPPPAVEDGVPPDDGRAAAVPRSLPFPLGVAGRTAIKPRHLNSPPDRHR